MVRKPKAEAAARPASDEKLWFPVVGMGASAGGLEALEEFFRKMPPDSGIAFVVVSHQHPGHTSLLPELLGKRTHMPVVEATDGVAIQANHVYIAAPGSHMALVQGVLHFMEPKVAAEVRLPIDYFFRSLAQDQQERAICIVLSGTGTDGTLGLREIKGVNGMTMAQSIESAKYPGMPSSAIMTNLVDFVLPPDEMPAVLLKYAKGLPRRLVEREAEGEAEKAALEPVQKIFHLLRSRTGHDFSGYKLNTIRRRLERRMNVHQIKNLAGYLRYLHENPHELDILFKELLINVTSFFRDPEAFDALEKALELHVLAAKPDEYPLRIWVPGCGSGEEAYSIAILVRESMERLKKHFRVQVFGTDLDSEAIDFARTGAYPEGIAVDVRNDRLKRFFLREDNGYRVAKEIREMVVLAPQNVLRDPPFTKLDLLSCRNLLIYLNADLQRQLLPIFHYSLKPGGLLFLGPSESVSSAGELFHALDKKWKIFQRGEAVHAQGLPEFPARVPAARVHAAVAAPGEAVAHPHTSALVERMLLQKYAPATVIVNDRGDIIYIHGRTGAYLEPTAGQPHMNIIEMAREGLRLELAAALRRAANKNVEVVQPHIRVKANGEHALVDIAVERVAEPEALRGLTMVTLRPSMVVEARSKAKSRAPLAHKEQSRVEELERELQYTKETLQTAVEELETSNEELKSTNEELQSTNEELQSTNEELETSREEMQSLNEELTTVNAELQSKVEDLSQANDDMQNLLNSTDIATIFLDNALNIKRFTKQAKRLVHLIDTDVGRPISDLVNELRYNGLVHDAEEVLRSLVFKEVEVQTTAGEWCLMRMMPYRTADNVIDGLVVTFIDINKSKHAEDEFVRTRDRLQRLLGHAPAVLYLRESKPDYDVTFICDNVTQLSGYSAAELTDRPRAWLDHVHPDDRKRVLAELRHAGDNQRGSMVYRVARLDGSYVAVRDQFTLVRDQQGQPLEIVGALTEADADRHA